jgi:hypothetical protein
MSTPFLPVDQLLALAQRDAMAGVGYSWPIPRMDAGALRVAVLRYHRTTDPSAPVAVFPPFHLDELDATTGMRLRSSEVTSADLGLPWPQEAALAAPGSRARDYATWEARARQLGALMPLVWADFAAAGATLDAAGRGRVRVYRALLADVEITEILPYHALVGADFDAWATRALDGGEGAR